MKSWPNSYRGLVLVAVLTAAYVAPRAAAWRGLDLAAPLRFGDTPSHLLNMDRMERLGQAGEDPTARAYFRRFPGERGLENATRWGRGVYQLASLWAHAAGVLSIWTTQLTNLCFTAVLLWGVFGLGRVLGGVRVGAWAALLALLCAPLAASTWYFNLDYPLTAMVAVGLLLLWRTRAFTSWSHTLTFAAWCALGQYVKMSYAIYLAAPAVVALVRGVRHHPWRAVLIRASTGLLVCAALTLLLLDVRLSQIWQDLHRHYVPPPGNVGFAETQIPPWTLQGIFALPAFAAMSYPLPLLLLALPGFVRLHLRGRGPSSRWLLVALVWGACLILTLMTNKLERYLHPLYPVVGLVTVWWIVARIPRRWQTALLALVAAAYLVTLYAVYRHPTPWNLGGKALVAQEMFYDLRMPSEDQLQRLRRRAGYHDTCQLGPLVDAMERVSREAGGGRGLLGVTALEVDENLLDGRQATLLLSHRLRTRHLHSVHQACPGCADALPAMIVLHPRRLDPSAHFDALRLVARREVALACVELPGKPPITTPRLVVSLLQGAGPSRPPAQSGEKSR